MSEKYYRCNHCKGFYETTRKRCRWCAYETPQNDSSGDPRIYPNRETCRAVQIAHYEQLPSPAHADHMKPPASNPDLVCYCLHCPPDAPQFEAIEMRWMANEKMWACPCTTCGGRGFMFDVLPAASVFRCSDCEHFYKPEKPTSKYAICPQCGSHNADGWYMDEDEDGEPIEDDDQVVWDDDRSEWSVDGNSPMTFDDIPFGSSECEAVDKPIADYLTDDQQMLDDIDYPRTFRDTNDESTLNEDDIPF